MGAGRTAELTETGDAANTADSWYLDVRETAAGTAAGFATLSMSGHTDVLGTTENLVVANVHNSGLSAFQLIAMVSFCGKLRFKGGIVELVVIISCAAIWIIRGF